MELIIGLKSGKFLHNLLKQKKILCLYRTRLSKNCMMITSQISVSRVLSLFSYSIRNNLVDMPLAISYVFVGLEDVGCNYTNKNLKRNHNFVKNMCGVR
jgi:hypothetical protein